jgi:trimethylamine:corrinoid methyltransferase-like protein
MKMAYKYNKEILRGKVHELLWDVGVKIENDELEQIMLGSGCKKGSNGRIKIHGNLIEDYVKYQKSRVNTDKEDERLYSYYGIDWAHHLIWNGKREEALKKIKTELKIAAFDCGPMKYYDYRDNKIKPIDTNIFTSMMKFAQSTDEIGYISTWYRSDVPPKIERIDSLILGLQYTDKVDGIEPMYPEVIKYLLEVSEIITNKPGDCSFLAGSESIKSPLILDRVLSEDILERKRRGVKRYHIASMPTIGVASPIALADSIVLGASEILGGLVISNCADPESDLSGRMICDMIDMRSAKTSCAMPEVSVVNLYVKDLFETFWGGNLWVETFMGTSAKRPGLHAVYENLFGAYCRSFVTGDIDKPYPLFGVLREGGIGSPTQAMLDIEIRRSQFFLKNKISIDNNHMPWDDFKEIISKGGGFLDDKYTLDHFRENFSGNVFLTKEPGLDEWEDTEKDILDICDNLWRKNVKEKYRKPDIAEDKQKALSDVLKRAKEELL